MYRRSLLSLWALALITVASSVGAVDLNPSRYDIYYGDINGDSYTDVYLKGKSAFVPVAGDIFIPLVLPAPPSVVMYRDATTSPCVADSGSCTYTTQAESGFLAPAFNELSASELNQLVIAQEGVDYFVGDLDGNGQHDLLIRGLSGTAQADILNDGDRYRTLAAQPLAITLASTSGDSTPAVLQTLTNTTLAHHNINDHAITLALRDTNGDGRDDIVVVTGDNVADIIYATTASGAVNGSQYQAVVATVPQPASFSGATAGEFNVSESGAATYSIPVPVAQGTANVAPQINLSYSSNSGDGIAGKGWSLGGLSAISRCRKTLAIDGRADPIQWNANDRFCLDGQRLILIAGSYGEPGATYKTELDSYALIKTHGGSAGHPDYFTVLRKDGSVSEYGNSTDARETLRTTHSNHVYTWAQNRFEDNMANAITFHYSNDDEGQRIQTIRYAYGADATYRAEVNFSYQPRPDITEGYMAGYPVKSTQRLHTISANNHENDQWHNVRTFNLHYQPYDPISDNKTSLLGSIQECVSTGCLPATVFDWQRSAVNEGFAAQSSHPLLNGTHKHHALSATPFDVNGDGKLDRVWLTTYSQHKDYHTLQYAISDGSALSIAPFAGGQTILTFNGPDKVDDKGRMQVIDYNGDGRQDVAVYVKSVGKWQVYLSVPSGGQWRLSTQPIAIDHLTDHKTVFSDFNADGLADAIVDNSIYYLEPSANITNVTTEGDKAAFIQALAQGQLAPPEPYQFTTTATTISWSPTYPQGSCSSGQGLEETREHKIYANAFGDINSDGNNDIIAIDRRECFYPEIPDTSIGEKPSGLGSQTSTKTSSTSTRGNREITERLYVLGQKNGEWFVYHYLGERDTTHSQGLADSAESRLERELNAQLIDINGDGLADLIRRTPVGETDSRHFLHINNGASFNSPVQFDTYSAAAGVQYGDINRDGKLDLIYHDRDAKALKYRLFDRTRFSGIAKTIIATNGDSLEQRSLVDINADGLPDYIRQTQERIYTAIANTADQSTQPERVITRITNGFGAETDITYQTLASNDDYRNVDFELTDRYDPYFQSGCDGSNLCKPSAPYGSSEFLTALRQSLMGWWDLPSSAQIMDEHRPVLPVNGPMFVVTQVASSAPAASATDPEVVDLNAKSRISYYYAGGRVQAAGRGFLGFQYLKTVDEQTGIKTTTKYRQDYPFVGSPLRTVTYSDRDNNGKLSQSDSDWRYTRHSGADGTYYYQVLLNSSTDVSYRNRTDATTGVLSVPGGKLQRATTNNTHDTHGNILAITHLTEGFANNGSVNFTQAKTTRNDYAANTVAIPGWDAPVSAATMGRLTKAVVETSLNNSPATIRTSSFTYLANGLLGSETVEPDAGSAFTLTSTHSYDSQGNKIQTSTTGWDGTNTVTRTSSSVYDASFRYAETTDNTFGQTVQTVLERDARGTPTKVSSLQGLESTIRFDALGREIERRDQTGSWARTEYITCSTSNCPAGAHTAVRKQLAGGGQTVEYTDVIGRTLRKGAIGFDGRWVYSDTQYDSMGRSIRQSEPFYDGDTRQWNTNYYDKLGRSWKIIAADGTTGYTETDGLTMVSTNHLGQTTTEVKNALGQLVQAIDHLGGKITYAYNIDGELVSLKSFRASNGTTAASETTLEYDRLGRKLAMNDPDKGRWVYTYNAFGELLTQTDAKGQTVTNTYDPAGRALTRTDTLANGTLEQYTQWAYDNQSTPATNGNNSRGQLTQIMMGTSTSPTCSSASTRECTTLTYDNLGRALNTERRLRSPTGQDLGTYISAVAYDSIGRAVQRFDALNGLVSDNQGLINSGVQSHFNAYGYPYKTTDIHTGDLLDEIKARDSRGNITERLQGSNGATTTYTYDPANGRLLNQHTDIAGLSAPIQAIDYQWDQLGNLSYRHNQSGGKNLQESFCYDGLNRLIKTNSGTTATSTCSGLTESAQDFKYDSLGNITYKHDVGHYTYGSVNNTAAAGDAGLHAVTATSDGHSYEYDNNGNMIIDRNGSSIDRRFTYSSFDKPVEIEKTGQHTTRFAYGQNRSRYWREDTDSSGVIKTTLYLGGLERISTSDSTTVEWKRYIGDSLHTVNTNAAGDIQSIDKRVIYKDHLGSSDVITDAVGSVIQSMSFDAWGQRRNADNWQAFTLASLTGFNHSETTKGFTGHEMLDEVGIIHMNGRIYDPRLARFLQADPHVQAPNDTQMLNRYSYVRNNPLNATDPSGYFVFTLMATMALATGQVTTAWIVGLAIGAAAFMDAASAGVGLGEALKSGVVAGLSAAAFVEIGKHFKGISEGNRLDYQPSMNLHEFGGNLLSPGHIVQQISAHAAVGGVAAALMGGKFGHGFLSAGVTKGVTGSVHGGSPLIRVAASATIGGTVSEISGGKFANGARTAVYQYLYNEWLTKAASLVVQLAPGYELYQCFAEDCSALEWAMAASSVTPMGKGVGILRKIYKSRKVCCFVAGTQILTKDGYKNIEDVAIGDWVWSKDTETGEQAFKRVVHLFVKHDREIFTLNVLDQDGNTLEVGTTDDHPFFVVGEGWKVTEDLVAGDAIETDGHGAVIVQSVSHDGHTEVTYNFEVEDFHTYYVTKKNLLVHNSECGDAAEEVAKSVDPNTIRFSQSSVNGAGDLTKSMQANGWKGEAIDVVKMGDGGLTTLDNTRVLAASRAGVNVQANIRNASDALPANMVERFTTKKGVPTTWGEAAQLRIGKQSAGWRNGN